MTRHATFLRQMREKMNRYGTFFNASGPIPKSQMNEKTRAFNNGRQKNINILFS
jgi:hypothetical protein